MRYKGFTRIPHYLLDTPCGLTHHERCALFCVYRQTAGYNRQSHRMSYSDLKKMSGVAGLSRICNSLAKKKMFTLTDKRKGGSYVFTIPLPITSGKHPDHMSSPPPSLDVNTPSHDVNTSRGAIDSSIDNTIDNIRERETLSPDLVNEMKSKYPNKDIDLALDKMFKYKKTKDVPDFAVRKWCEDERPTKMGISGMDVNAVVKNILKKISDIGSHKQPTFGDGEADVENTVKRIGWSNLCRMDEFELRARVKSLND